MLIFFLISQSFCNVRCWKAKLPSGRTVMSCALILVWTWSCVQTKAECPHPGKKCGEAPKRHLKTRATVQNQGFCSNLCHCSCCHLPWSWTQEASFSSPTLIKMSFAEPDTLKTWQYFAAGSVHLNQAAAPFEKCRHEKTSTSLTCAIKI